MKRVVTVLLTGVTLLAGCANAMDLGADLGDGGPSSMRAGEGGDQETDGSAMSDARRDGGKGDGDSAPEGSPCSGSEEEEATCGKCGTKTRECRRGTDGRRTWGPWSACTGESQAPDACNPTLTYADEACGNCGKRERICQTDCRFDATLACVEPTFNGEAACAPGSVDYSYGGTCAGANAGRKRTCNATCDWGAFGACETLAPLGGAGLVSAMPSQACVVVAGGAVKCWSNSTAQIVPGISGATAVSVGGGFVCAVIANDTVKCWGNNDVGQLGNATTTYSTTPVDVIGLSGVRAIAAGGHHACALLNGGTIKCWGEGSYGRLGRGVPGSLSAPSTAVSGITGATALVSGVEHSCAVVSGLVKCWGRNDSGELGTGTNLSSDVPVAALGITGATSVGGSAGFQGACAIIAGGAVKCWGENELGIIPGASPNGVTTPTQIQNVSGATSLAVGRGFSTSGSGCAVISGGTVKCWGWNFVGQLGVPPGLGTGGPNAVEVQALSGAVAVAAGGDYNCAQVTGGAVKCWGGNNFGMLGTGTQGGESSTPVTVVGVP